MEDPWMTWVRSPADLDPDRGRADIRSDIRVFAIPTKMLVNAGEAEPR